MGRFETRWLTAEKNLSALADLSGQWIDTVNGYRPPRGIVLDMDSSVSPTHGTGLSLNFEALDAAQAIFARKRGVF
jgi:hypothetical protein